MNSRENWRIEPPQKSKKDVKSKLSARAPAFLSRHTGATPEQAKGTDVSTFSPSIVMCMPHSQIKPGHTSKLLKGVNSLKQPKDATPSIGFVSI